MACLEHATELDPTVRAEVQERAAKFIPPGAGSTVRDLAAVGPMVLELLPGPEGCADEQTAYATVMTAGLIESDAAIPFLKPFRAHPSAKVRTQLLWNWQRFDLHEYFEEIVKQVPSDNVEYVAWTQKHLQMLIDAGFHAGLELCGLFTAEDVRTHLSPNELVSLTLADNYLFDDLRVLRDFTLLQRLALLSCPGIDDYSPLAELPLHHLYYTPFASNNILSFLPPSLSSLWLLYQDDPASMGIRQASEVTELRLQLPHSEGVGRWVAVCFPNLRTLAVDYHVHSELDVSALSALPHLKTLLIINGVPTRVPEALAQRVRIEARA
jgi:hypothetical protein